MKRRNPIARALRYLRRKVERDRTKYTRKRKHKASND